MAKVVFGNHSSVIVPQRDRDSIRKFYCDVLGGVITKEENERDFLRLGDNFYIGFLYGDLPDESAFLRTARSVWLEIKSDDVEEMSRKILESGLEDLAAHFLHVVGLDFQPDRSGRPQERALIREIPIEKPDIEVVSQTKEIPFVLLFRDDAPKDITIKLANAVPISLRNDH